VSGEPAPAPAASLHVGFGLLTLFPERVGGTETYVRNLLAEFVSGHGPERVTVLANRHVEVAYRERVGGPVHMHRVRSYRAGDSQATRALAMTGAALAPAAAARDVPSGLDVLHHAVTVPIPRVKDVPTVVTIHEIQQHDRRAETGRAERLYRRWAYDGSARRADVTIAITHHLKDRLVEHLGIDPGRVEVVHYGVDLDRYTAAAGAADERVRAELGLTGRYLLYPANVWPHKNHRRLLEAFARVRDDELELILAGQTYGRLAELERAAAELGVAGRVRHVGFIRPEQLPAAYRGAVAMLFPSLYEGFGAPPLEAMACGCPVASSLRHSLAEVCGDAALELDPDDPTAMAAAIEAIGSDAQLRERLVARGAERVKAFSWRRAAERHVEVYRRAAGGG
jgi:glycosyltransferase involved in cell wall biosynthesis